MRDGSIGQDSLHRGHAVLVRQIREAIAEENRKDIIERLWKERQERARKGQFPGGNVPYGYRRSSEGFAVDPAEAAVVRLIFELAEREGTKSAIARVLQGKGLTRRNGRPWTRRQVSAVLERHSFYRDGIISYGKATGRQALSLLG